jgi:hypothetical protein
MASNADGFKALRGREGVTGSTHSRWGGGLKATSNASNLVSMARGEGDRRCGPTSAAASLRPGGVGRLQRETTQAKRKERAEYGHDRWGCTKIFTIFKQLFEFKTQGFKYFQTKFELDSK